MTAPSRPYQQDLMADLQDPREAAAYLTAALNEEALEVFLVALRDVAEAHGMKRLAEGAQLNRESLYRMLSERGNPQLTSLTAVLGQLGLRLAVQTKGPLAA